MCLLFLKTETKCLTTSKKNAIYWQQIKVSVTANPPHQGRLVTARQNNPDYNFKWPGGPTSGCHAGGRVFDSGRTITLGLKIIEEKVPPLQFHPHMIRLSTLLG